MITREGFESSNRLRDYPFLQAADPPPALPRESILDFASVVGPGSGYDPAVHAVYLRRAARSGGRIDFEFGCDAPGLVGYALRFSRDVADAPYATDDAAAAWEGPGPDPGVASWSGALVTGELGPLAELLGDGGAMAGDWPVEPALVRAMDDLAISRLRFWNHKRNMIPPPEGCEEDPGGSHMGLGGDYVLAAAFASGGVLRLRDGYSLALGTSSSSVLATAQAGTGLGLPDREVPVAPGEAPPPGSDLLTGGVSCEDVILAVNGLAARELRIVGARVEPDPGNFTVHVYLDLAAAGACADVDPEPIPELPEEG